MLLIFLLSLGFTSMVLQPQNIFSLGQMNLGFFPDIVKNTGSLFPYEILPVKDVTDILPLYNHPSVHNIVHLRDLHCSNTPNIRQ